VTPAVLLLGDGWGPAWLILPLLAVLLFVRGRFLLDLIRRTRSGEIDPKDDWDPFR